MIHILVVIQVADFEAFEIFERAVVSIMRDYGGVIVSAFETARHPDGSGEEVHCVAFESEEGFRQYRLDFRYLALTPLRQRAISGTEVKLGLETKYYG